MKKLVALCAFLCVGQFVTGCNNPKGQEAKEKMKEVGGELLETGEKAAGALKSGAESVIEAGEKAGKSATEATSKALERDKSNEPK